MSSEATDHKKACMGSLRWVRRQACHTLERKKRGSLEYIDVCLVLIWDMGMERIIDLNDIRSDRDIPLPEITGMSQCQQLHPIGPQNAVLGTSWITLQNPVLAYYAAKQ